MILTRDIHLKTPGHTAVEDITSMVQMGEQEFLPMSQELWPRTPGSL